MATLKSIASDDVHFEKKGVTMVEDIDGTNGLDTIEDTKPGAFVWLCASAAAIGGMLFGCECNSVVLQRFIDLLFLKTIPVLSPVFWSFWATISAAERSLTLRKKPSQRCVLPEHSLEQF
jgi:hypothetical protein